MDDGANESLPVHCPRNRKCSKKRQHPGKCNSERQYNKFWEKSQFFNLRKDQGQLSSHVGETSVQEAKLREDLLARQNYIESEVKRANETVERATCELEASISEKGEVDKQVVEQEHNLQEITHQYEKLKVLLDQKQYSRTRRQKTSTSFETIMDRSSSVRYRRRQETKNVLEYIHGGEEGALLGAWDFITANASKEMMDKLFARYRRGKYLEGLITQAVRDFSQSKESLTQAVAFKYQNFLSRRKFNMLCKTQSSVFDAKEEVWVPRNMKCLGVDVKLPLNHISDESVEKFVKSLDIGNVYQIPNVPGVTRTVTGLVFMIIDLHLRLPHLSRQLVWFNGNTNHFVFQFSDDGAPETSQLTMSIGSMTFWNLGQRVRSREFQYLLHCVSLGEKHDVLELLWQQHSDEMQLLESSIFTVCGKECTMEFQPSADMSWQSWACNELNQAATHPSPYANVHKGNLSSMGGSIGLNGNLWQPYISEVREEHVKKVSMYLDTLPEKLSVKVRHDRKLAFMAENGIRQLGKPRIGIFANRVRPDPLHCEINAWQHLLDLIYAESVQRGLFQIFIQILSAPIGLEIVDDGSDRERVGDNVDNSDTLEGCLATDGEVGCLAADGEVVVLETDSNEEGDDDSRLVENVCNVKFPEFAIFDHALSESGQFSMSELQKRANDNLNKALAGSASTSSHSTTVYGCGLAYLASKIQEHYNNEAKRFNKLPIRLIGDQAISLARHCYRLVDCLKTEVEKEQGKLKRVALSKAVQNLRNAGGLFNKIHFNCSGELEQLSEFCQTYFNLLALFFPHSINVTVWTVGYAIPYHAKKLYEEYIVGFGILSLQAKESKHAGLKGELSLTNRSKHHSSSGKWWQVMKSDYVRSFYLPEHQPAPPSYASHFKSRAPSHCGSSYFCDCGRKKNMQDGVCIVCFDGAIVIACAKQQQFSDEVIAILKPVICNKCNKRFADIAGLNVHSDAVHSISSASSVSKTSNSESTRTIPKSMSVQELKSTLRAKGLSTSGRKDILIRRLEGVLTADL